MKAKKIGKYKINEHGVIINPDMIKYEIYGCSIEFEYAVLKGKWYGGYWINLKASGGVIGIRYPEKPYFNSKEECLDHIAATVIKRLDEDDRSTNSCRPQSQTGINKKLRVWLSRHLLSSQKLLFEEWNVDDTF